MLIFEVMEPGLLKIQRNKDLCEIGFIYKDSFFGHQSNKNMKGCSSQELRQIADKLDELNNYE